MRTVHEAALDPLRSGSGARGGGGRAEAVRFAATHTLPVLVRGFVSGGARGQGTHPCAAPARPRWSAAALRALRERHGSAPVQVRGPAGTALLLLDPQDLRRFHTEPSGEPRGARRWIHDEVLAAEAPVHPSCGPFLAAVAAEAPLLTAAGSLELTRARHTVARIGRRIVLGDAAAGDEELTSLLGQLRGGRARNARTVRTLHDKAVARIRQYAAQAAPHTLVGRAARHGDPVGPAQDWLAAMDAVPATLLRTLLLLGAHPAEQDAAAAEAGGGACDARAELPRLRACVRESLRLFPVVPDLVRVTRTETEWQGERHPPGTTLLAPAAFHQRDPEHVPAAHVFVPGRWKAPASDHDMRMAPFGHGAGRCPGSRLGLLLTSALCAEVLRGHRVESARPVLNPTGPLPMTLDPQGIRLLLGHR
ncbi:cytochrome P450 [Streptomyces sp. NPDC060028]|uniref:cytochrome P450 n=1 Tax=Streptomyces sp. NPDC060028 TaxID=3347041 RepID=UPI00367E70E0